ncbi:MAG: hypothetical protein P8Y70_03870 [Candidatus Lokiarchaeota archaeon]
MKTYLNILSVLAIPLFLLGLTISIVIAYVLGHYSIFFNTISELGSTSYTPFPIIINLTFMISPFFLSFFFLKLFNVIQDHVKNHKHINNLSVFGFSLFCLMNLAFIFVGIFNVDISILIHTICTIFVFVPLIFGEIIMGVIILIKKIFHPFFAIAMIFGHFTVSMFYFITQAPLLEWIVFFVLMLWGIPLSVLMVRKDGKLKV